MMRLLVIFFAIFLMTACGQSDSKKEEPADPAKAEEMETPAETEPSEGGDKPPGKDAEAETDTSEGGDKTPGKDAETEPGAILPATDEK